TDDEVASALAAAGEAARSGGAFADAACALARAGDLTTDPDRRARLLLEAAASAVIAGRLPWGRQLIARAEESVRDPLLAADLRATLARVQARAGSPGPGADRLVAEAERLLPGEPQRAAMFLLEAAAIDMAAGRLHRLVERAARSQELAADVLPGVAGLARILVAEAQIALGEGEEGDAVLAAAEGDLVRFVPGTGPIEIVAMAAQSSMWVERFDRAEAILERLISTLRDAGLVTELVYPLAVRAQVQLRLGRTQRALADASEAVALGEEGALDTVLVVALGVLAEVEATLGQDEACWSHATRAVGMAEAMGAPAAALYGHAALALLELGRGRIEEAADHGLAAERAEALTNNDEAAIARYLANLAEALWRTGDSAGARERAEVLERQGARPGHSWAAGCAARLRGLLAADDAVDAWFAAALEHHGPNDRPFEAARTRLLHGERLRRARRPADARRPLRAALATFERMGALTWAERARAELRAAGGPAPARDAAPGSDPLTPQELQVALLAAQGQTNREIGAGLFLSPKTVEHHLSRTFRKLGIRRRSELAGALPAE
uniref:helix-turn-helix transcriptional regulator n=1 Tax=Paraconexibacter sp. TaxID=2949640 RepID=UPI003562F519